MANMTVMIFEEAVDELIKSIKVLTQSDSHAEDIMPSSACVTFRNYKISFGWQKVFCGEQEILLTKIDLNC